MGVKKRPEGAVETAAPESGTNTEIKEEGDYKLPEWRMRLRFPFEFEGEKFEEIDLSGLFELKAWDMVEVDREMRKHGEPNRAGYLFPLLVAAKANKKPFEWLYGMSAFDINPLWSRVYSFFAS